MHTDYNDSIDDHIVDFLSHNPGSCYAQIFRYLKDCFFYEVRGREMDSFNKRCKARILKLADLGFVFTQAPDRPLIRPSIADTWTRFYIPESG